MGRWEMQNIDRVPLIYYQGMRLIFNNISKYRLCSGQLYCTQIAPELLDTFNYVADFQNPSVLNLLFRRDQIGP